jgi:hypothetical protein
LDNATLAIMACEQHKEFLTPRPFEHPDTAALARLRRAVDGVIACADNGRAIGEWAAAIERLKEARGA